MQLTGAQTFELHTGLQEFNVRTLRRLQDLLLTTSGPAPLLCARIPTNITGINGHKVYHTKNERTFGCIIS